MQLSTIRKTIQWLTRALCFCGMFLLIPMMLLTTGDVVCRAVWARHIPGTVKGHVRVSMLTSRLPERAQLLLDAIATLLSLFIISILAWQGWVVGIEEQTVSDMLRIPQSPFRLLVSVAGLFLCLELLVDLAVSVEKLVRR